MCVIALLTMFFTSHAEVRTLDQKRLAAFETHLHKKEAHEARREKTAYLIKQQRARREQRYEAIRDAFRRPTVTKPQGEGAYNKRMEAKAQQYEQKRERFAQQKQRLAETLDEKIDRTKMVEYNLEN